MSRVMRPVSLAVAGMLLVGAGCGAHRYAGGPGSPAAKQAVQTAAIHQALKAVPRGPVATKASFPKQVGIAPCTIGAATAGHSKSVSGTCSTNVQSSGPDKVVTFTETWNAQAAKNANDPSQGLLISVWQITLDPSGKVIRQTHFGDAPPPAK